jgi:hypothetical protein
LKNRGTDMIQGVALLSVAAAVTAKMTAVFAEYPDFTWNAEQNRVMRGGPTPCWYSCGAEGDHGGCESPQAATARMTATVNVSETGARWHGADEMCKAALPLAARMGVRVRQIHLRPMTMKWASISTRGRLTLNTALLDVPRALGTFVFVHELAHLLAPNHGKVFKASMDAYFPYRRRHDGLTAYTEAP